MSKSTRMSNSTRMSQKSSSYHQHVKIDYTTLEKKQWQAIRSGGIAAEFTRRWHVSGENFPFPEAAPIVFVIIDKINQHIFKIH